MRVVFRIRKCEPLSLVQGWLSPHSSAVRDRSAAPSQAYDAIVWTILKLFSFDSSSFWTGFQGASSVEEAS